MNIPKHSEPLLTNFGDGRAQGAYLLNGDLLELTDKEGLQTP